MRTLVVVMQSTLDTRIATADGVDHLTRDLTLKLEHAQVFDSGCVVTRHVVVADGRVAA